jgi:hypothetical protein
MQPKRRVGRGSVRAAGWHGRPARIYETEKTGGTPVPPRLGRSLALPGAPPYRFRLLPKSYSILTSVPIGQDLKIFWAFSSEPTRIQP